MLAVCMCNHAKNHAAIVITRTAPKTNFGSGHVPNAQPFLGFVAFLSLLQCPIQTAIFVMQDLQSMRSRVKVRTCRSSTTASSSLPSVDDPSYPPVTTSPQQYQGWPGEFDFSDGSDALFSMHLRLAEEEDHMRVESWRGYAEEIVVFVSLSSYAPSHSSCMM